MKRSQINKIIADAKALLAEHHQSLPPFAFWSLEDWKQQAPHSREILDCMLGWDITDFGSGDFRNVGLFLFTLRNGKLNSEYTKKYAQKYLVVQENQVTPYHYHWHKAEDIINVAGGDLVIRLYNADEKDDFADTPVNVHSDGQCRQVPAGGIVRLKPGESITLLPYQYHSFWAEGGTAILMEVSDVNDDKLDNCFHAKCGRFSAVEEDEPPVHLLVSDYDHWETL